MKKHVSILFRVLGYYAAYIFLANIASIFILFILKQFGISNIPQITGEFISDVLLLPILILVFHLYREEKKEQLFKDPLEWKKLLKLIPLSLVARLLLVVAISVLAVLLIIFFNQDLSEIIDSGVDFQWSIFDQGSEIERIFGFFSFVIFGPINEELLNRAVIFEYLRTHYSLRTSIIYSSTIFMFAHLHPGLYISSFLLGLVLAYVYSKWKNLWYPIILHMLINLHPFILSYFLK